MQRQRLWFLAFSTTAVVAAFAASCGGGGDTSGTGARASSSTASSMSGSGGEGASGFNPDAGTGQSLQIEPQDPVLDVDGTPKSVALTAKRSDGTTLSSVTWLLDDVLVGSISAEGVFRSPGFVAGKAKVTAQSGELTGTTTVTVRVRIVDNAGNVSDADRTRLEAGGTADPAFRWLYPYDKTIFPRGIGAPLLQLGGAAADATYIRIAFGDFEYRGFFGPSAPARVQLPEAAWKGITQSAGASDTVEVQATKLSGGGVTGPSAETWRVAQGSLKGVIYYNTYRSRLTNTGAVMRIRPGGDAEVMLGGCTVCHSVSANGNVLAAGVDWGAADDPNNPADSASYDLGADATATERYSDTDGRKFAFGALTPNGEYLLTNGVPAGDSTIRGLEGTLPTQLIDTATGLQVPSPTLAALVRFALTPAFSPDGKRIAFNAFDTGAGRSLAMMDFDGASTPPVFSNLVELSTVTTGVVGWPSFTPDGLGVVYHEGQAFDTAGYGGQPRTGELRLVDTQSHTTSTLAALNGFEGDTTYLPYGEAEEAHCNYEPTVLPVAVGGYYWAVFTSRRAYGNTIAPGGTVPGGDNRWGTLSGGQENPSPRKKLWIAAIDIDFQGKPDPSHPAFYLPGQELEAGNMRGFAALEPCKQNGSSCESGAECCDGFCRQTGVDADGNPVLQCIPPPGGCAHEDESCTTAADCCDGTAICINGRCALPTPQ